MKKRVFILLLGVFKSLKREKNVRTHWWANADDAPASKQVSSIISDFFYRSSGRRPSPLIATLLLPFLAVIDVHREASTMSYRDLP